MANLLDILCSLLSPTSFRKQAAFYLSLCTVIVVFVAPAAASAAVDFSVLINFNGTNGTAPEGPLIQATDGSLYGTTGGGGACGYQYGCGTVFRITSGGKLETIYNFCALANCADGSNPQAGLVQAPDGSFYGTTGEGGDSSCNAPFGCGTIFKITAEGKLTTLHQFSGDDGAFPMAALILASDEDFYGTTWRGGISNEQCAFNGGPTGCGTVFKITPRGVFTLLYRFCSQTNCTDGTLPLGSLVQATNGKFYGTASAGGTGADPYCALYYGCGTIFEITSSGGFKTVFSFCAQGKECPGGAFPAAGLIQAADGDLWGTTDGTPASHGEGWGTAFKITLEGKFTKVTTLYGYSSAPLVQATDGNFYGTDYIGGTDGIGSVFELTPRGRFATLHSFDGNDGEFPGAGLLQATDGTFYGTTQLGGSDPGGGVVFTLLVGLGPFVALEPAYGRVGAKIVILGNHLKATTGVTFNGTPAKFDAVSNSEITAIVPSGATSGTVEVALPKKILKSNVAFRVIQ